jgi:hypothetical protein
VALPWPLIENEQLREFISSWAFELGKSPLQNLFANITKFRTEEQKIVTYCSRPTTLGDTCNKKKASAKESHGISDELALRR